MLVWLEPSLPPDRCPYMTHSTKKNLIKFVAPLALATIMMLSGPVFHLAQLDAAPEPQLANETVIYKQQTAPAAGVETAPGKVGMAS